MGLGVDFLSIAIVILLIELALAFTIYLFRGLSYYKAAKLEKLDHAWLSWIPFASDYMMLKLANKSGYYMFLFVIIYLFALTPVEAILFYTGEGALLLSIFFIVIGILGIVIQIQSLRTIAHDYNMSSAWFIIGVFILPVLLIAYIILYRRVNEASQHIENNQLNYYVNQ